MNAMKKEKDIFVDDLGFLYERDRHLWIEREWKHFRLKGRLKKALREDSSVRIVASGSAVAEQLHRYYRVPSERISFPED